MNEKRPENIGRYISQIYRKGSSFIAKGLSGYGIGSGQVMFLLELYRQDGRSQEDLSDTLNIDKGTTARALKKLEEENFVIRLKDEYDKRAYKIYLTEKGSNAKYDVYKVLEDWNTVIASGITNEEKDLVIELLKKICINQDIR